MTTSRLVLTFVALCAACGGDDPVGSSSVSGITPASAYFGRTIEVFISGMGTHFAGEPVITFDDPEVKSLRVDVLSTSSLRASIEVGFGARTGPHDVIVTTPGVEEARLPGGINLSPSLRYEASSTVARGGLVDFALTNVDTENPFGGEAPLFTSGAIAVAFTEVSATRIAGTALVDLLAPLGGLRLGLLARSVSGELLGFATAADDPMAPKVAPAPPVLALARGATAGTEAINAPRHTNLYKVNAPGDEHVLFVSMKSVGGALRTTSGARLVGAMAPASGKFGEGSPLDTTFGADRSAPASESASVPFADIETDGPYFSTEAAIDTKDDADYVLVTAKNTGRVFVHALPIDSLGTLSIAIFGHDPGVSNCTAFVAGGLGTTQAEVTVTAGTTYCVRVGSTSQTTVPYRLVVTPEL